VDQVGELVITEPMPSMPIYFWGDADGSRLREAYFEMFPGVWRHGDWIEITSRGTAIITGRSDSTINRGGVRMGTAEIYRAVMSVPEVLDALVVDLPPPASARSASGLATAGPGRSHPAGSDGWMPLFVVLRPRGTLDDDLIAALRGAIRSDCSPRHVPDGVDAGVDGDQAASLHAVLDRLHPEPGFEQLRPRHVSVLAPGQRRDQIVDHRAHPGR